MSADRGTCAACGAILATRGAVWRCSQQSESGTSGGMVQSFYVCSWCVDQMRVRGAVERANARQQRTPNQNAQAWQRAKIAMPPWFQRRVDARSKR